jgi:hypothetical protein
VSAEAKIRAQAREVAAGWSPPDAPDSWRLTAALFEAIAAHDALVSRLAVLPLPASLVRDYQQHGVFAFLGARTFHRGTDRGRLLARAHPSGQWLEWLDPGPS